MPTMFKIFDRETGEVLTRCGADVAEILHTQPERFTREIPENPQPALKPEPEPEKVTAKK